MCDLDYTPRDALGNVLSEAARILAYQEDPMLWPARIEFFLKQWEQYAKTRTATTVRAAGTLSFTEAAITRLTASILRRIVAGRWP